MQGTGRCWIAPSGSSRPLHLLSRNPPPVSKLISAAALTTITMLLVGCSSDSSNQTAASPAPTASTSAALSTFASGSPSQSASPAATPSPAPSTTSAAEPTPEPAPTAPPAPEPVAPPVVGVITPDPEWDAAQITVPQGASFTINGTGYEPGDVISINLGIAQSDGMVMEEQTAIADGAGSYSFTITVEADLEPGKYAVLTFVDDARTGPEFEATKRFASVDVISG